MTRTRGSDAASSSAIWRVARPDGQDNFEVAGVALLEDTSHGGAQMPFLIADGHHDADRFQGVHPPQLTRQTGVSASPSLRSGSTEGVGLPVVLVGCGLLLRGWGVDSADSGAELMGVGAD